MNNEIVKYEYNSVCPECHSDNIDYNEAFYNDAEAQLWLECLDCGQAFRLCYTFDFVMYDKKEK